MTADWRRRRWSAVGLGSAVVLVCGASVAIQLHGQAAPAAAVPVPVNVAVADPVLARINGDAVNLSESSGYSRTFLDSSGHTLTASRQLILRQLLEIRLVERGLRNRGLEVSAGSASRAAATPASLMAGIDAREGRAQFRVNLGYLASYRALRNVLDPEGDERGKDMHFREWVNRAWLRANVELTVAWYGPLVRPTYTGPASQGRPRLAGSRVRDMLSHDD